MASTFPVLTSEPIGGSDVDLYDDPNMQRQKLLEAAATVVSRLSTLAKEQTTKRKNIEARWLEDLEAYSGKYDTATRTSLESTKERSRAFVNMTRAKTNAWRARLSDLLFPADDRNWGISPTPVPELADGAKEAAAEASKLHEEAEQAVERANRANAAGDEQTMADEQMVAFEKGALAKQQEAKEQEARRILELAKRRSEGMAREIDDALTECKYPSRSRDVIDDAVKLGVGIMKGPLTANRPRRKWAQAQPSQDNAVPGASSPAPGYSLQSEADPRPEFRRVDPWSFFPDMNAATIEECEFTFERHLPTKKELRKMARTLDFDKDAVREVLNDEVPSRGSDDDLAYLSQLRAITGEEQAVTGRYVVWEFHGNLECEDIVSLLHAVGEPARDGEMSEADRFKQEYDVLDEQMVVIYFCRGRVLKISTDYTLDSGESLYSVFSFERGEGSLMSAIGIPRIMRDGQRALNGAWRMILDNGALATGPQVVIDKTQVEPEDGSWRMTPRKVWLKSAGQPGTNSPPFEVFSIPMNQAQLAGIVDMALKFIDEETALPMISQGEQGPNVTQTMGGMSMLFSSANVVFRRVVKNWDDDMTTPNIRRIYDWEMQFSPKEEIKGDMQTEARGTSVLLVREMQAQQLMAISAQWSAHPVLGPALKVYDMMRMTFQALSLNPDDVMLERDAFEAKLKQMAEGAAQSPDVIRAQASIEAAKIQAQSREMDNQTSLQIATINRETELIGLASKEQIGLKQLEAMIGIKQIEVDSKERSLAAEIGTEKEMAAEARARGERPTGSGGAISAGTINA